MQSSSTPFLFTVARRVPELLAPAKPTPRERKILSDIDDQETLRIHPIPVLHLYPGENIRENRNIGPVIREALAKALVYYYPLAGRLREGPGRKLAVDCNAEGVEFVEADAEFTLEDLRRGGGLLSPPFPCVLFPVVPVSSSGVLDCPLAYIQVTRLKCGGFSFALRMVHCMTDAAGVVQFLNAVAELARGAPRPSIEPVWDRELLLARDPPGVTCTHREYDQVNGTTFPDQYMAERVIERSFFFGPAEISAIRRCLQPNLKRCNTYEILSAFLWRCRTIALRFDPCEEVRYMCMISARPMLNPPLPAGYYGNAFVFSAAITTAGELSTNSLDYAVELIKKAKAEVTAEYVRSMTDFMETHARAPYVTVPGSWLVSDSKSVGYLGLDFGWGKPVYGGLATVLDVRGAVPGTVGFFVTGRNKEGERGVLAMLCLPETAIERFGREVCSVVGEMGVLISSPKL